MTSTGILVADVLLAASRLLPSFDLHEHVFDLWRGAALPDTIWTVSMGGLVALACAWLGCFLILQGQALLGDAISHTVLLGIVVAALVTGSVGSGSLLLAAAITGLLTTSLIEAIRGASRIKEDAATGIVFTSLFALGVLLLSTLASNAHLDPQHALYGMLEFVPSGEKSGIFGFPVPVSVLRMFVLCLLLLAGLMAFFKQLLVTSFDRQLAESLGMRPRLIRLLLLAALSLTVVGAFSSVGAVLVVGLLVAPPATAYLMTERLPRMLAWASFFGVASSLVGYHVAYWLEVTAAGTMVAVACFWFTLAFLFAPREGVISRLFRQLVLRVRTGHENIARLLLKLGAVPECPPVSLKTLADSGDRPLALVTTIVQQLRWRGWIERVEGTAGGVRLSNRGLDHARRLDRAHRLWEAYLVERVGVAHDHVHPTAEKIEHLLDDQLVARLDDALGHPGIDPHGAPIPRIPVSEDRPTVFALSRLQVGETGRLVGLSPSVDSPRTEPRTPETEAIIALRLKLGERFRVVQRDVAGGTWTITLDDGRRIDTPHVLADQILVDVEANPAGAAG